MSDRAPRKNTENEHRAAVALVSKWAEKQAPPGRSDLSFGSADPVKLQQAIALVTESGAAILLAMTSDGGALSLQVLDNGTKWKRWPSTVDTLDGVLEEIIATVIR